MERLHGLAEGSVNKIKVIKRTLTKLLYKG